MISFDASTRNVSVVISSAMGKTIVEIIQMKYIVVSFLFVDTCHPNSDKSANNKTVYFLCYFMHSQTHRQVYSLYKAVQRTSCHPNFNRVSPPGGDTHLHTSNLQIYARTFKPTNFTVQYFGTEDHGRLNLASQIWSCTFYLRATLAQCIHIQISIRNRSE